MAIKHNCELKLDLSFYTEESNRKFALTEFKIDAEIATANEIEYLKHKQFLQANKWRQLLRPKPYLVLQQEFEFSQHYFKTRKDVYLEGYWQAEDFFLDKAIQIRSDFAFRKMPSMQNIEILNKVNTCNAVSLHIRRGDYLGEQFITIHGVCSLTYYQEAIRIMANKVSNPTFFVFSDDIEWAKINVKTTFEIFFVDVNDDKNAFEDLRLMANCKHHILANSSFSWWGAWLSEYMNKITIAPKNWFADQKLNQSAKSITSKNWIRI